VYSGKKCRERDEDRVGTDDYLRGMTRQDEESLAVDREVDRAVAPARAARELTGL
jgi:hypothetical protein